jgi:hypothetical protein
MNGAPEIISGAYDKLSSESLWAGGGGPRTCWEAPTTCRFAQDSAAPAGPAYAELENGASVGSSGREVKKREELGACPETGYFGASDAFSSATGRGGAGWVVQKWRPHRGQTQN